MFFRHFILAFFCACAASASVPPGLAQRVLGVEEHAARMAATRTDIAEQVARMQAGGRQAARALMHLTTLATDTDAKQIMRVLGVEAAAARLMQSPASDDTVQGLAGSVITLLSGMPVTSEISDEKTGSHGQVHIVVPRPSRIYAPDRQILDLNAGVRPSKVV